MKTDLKNISASVHFRLVQLSHQRKEDPNFILTRYALERFLYRLSNSPSATDFVLKGAMLLLVWGGQPYRPTWDIDLLGNVQMNEKMLLDSIATVCKIEVPDDGMRYDTETIRIRKIREDIPYGGWRVNLTAFLGKARIPIQIDIGQGDVLYPPARKLIFPTLLDFPAPKLLGYAKETMISEKFEAIVSLGMLSSRMKDYHDIYQLAQSFLFKEDILSKALAGTFKKRSTPLPQEIPPSLTAEFSNDREKQIQWVSFIKRNRISLVSPSLHEIVKLIGVFLLPVCMDTVKRKKFANFWPPGGPWKYLKTQK